VRIKSRGSRCKIRHLETASAVVLTVVEQVYQSRGKDPELTSHDDDPHGTSSRHWYGGGWDFGTRGLGNNDKQIISNELEARLGRDFDVVLEQDHIHIEWEPRA
jgi:hypothetical protein